MNGKLNYAQYQLAQNDRMNAQKESKETEFELDHIFGASGNVDGGICVLNENEFAYAATRHVVVKNVETQEQRFIHTEEITAMVVSRARDLMAVATKGGLVKFYDTSTLRCKGKIALSASSGAIHLSLSKDRKVCLILSGQPDFVMTMWKMDKASASMIAEMSLATSSKKAILKADVCPTNNFLVSVLGRNTIQMYQATTKNANNRRFIAVALNLKMDSREYNTQCWLSSGDLVLGTEIGEVLIIGENRDLKAVLQAEHPISSIVECRRGMIVGCSQGSLLLHQQTNGEFLKNFTHKSLIEKSKINSMGLMRSSSSPSSAVICLTQSGSIVEIPLSESKKGTQTVIVPSLNQSTSEVFLSTKLVLDVCVWIPVIAVGGYDGVLRIFNYQSKQLLLLHQFEDGIRDICFHPSGTHILLSLATKVLLCSVLTNEFEVVWKVEDLPYPCLVRFSDGGGRFAVCLTTIVQIHDFYTPDFENICTLRGHSKSIISQSFAPYGNEFCTIGADGVVCLWDTMRGLTKTRCVDVLSPSYVAGCLSWNKKCAYAMSADCLIKKIDIEKGTILSELKYDPLITAMTVNPVHADGQEGMIASLENGNVESLVFKEGHLIRRPLNQLQNATSFCYSKDSSNFMLVSARTSVSIYKCSANSKAISLTTKGSPFEGVLVISQCDIDEKAKKLEFYKSETEKVQSVQSSISESTRLNHEKAMGDLNIELQESLSAARKESDFILKEIGDLNLSHQDKSKLLDQQNKLSQMSIHEEGEKKIENEKNTTHDFTARCEQMRQEHERKLQSIQKQYQTIFENETRDHMEEMACEDQKCQQMIKSISSLRNDFEKEETALEEDADLELTVLAEKHYAHLKTLKRSNQLLQNEKDILQRRYEGMLNDLRELQEQVTAQEDKCQDAERVISDLDYSIASSHAAILEQDRTIRQKERDMSSYSQSNLEDEQTNLDLIDERKKIEESMKPYEQELKLTEKTLEQKTGEVKDEENKAALLQVDLDGSKLKLKQTKSEFRSVQEKCAGKEGLLLEMENQLECAMKSMNDIPALKSCLRSLSEEYLHGRSQRKSHITNDEKLKSINAKSSSMKKTIQQRKRSHGVNMKKLLREHGILEAELEETTRLITSSQLKIAKETLSNDDTCFDKQNELIVELELKALGSCCHNNENVNSSNR